MRKPLKIAWNRHSLTSSPNIIQHVLKSYKYFSEKASKVVISTTANDDFEFKQKWSLDKGQQEKILEELDEMISENKDKIDYERTILKEMVDKIDRN